MKVKEDTPWPKQLETTISKFVRMLVNSSASVDKSKLSPFSTVSGPIPDDLRDSQDTPSYLILTDKETHSYYQILKSLYSDSTFEHNNRKDIASSFWRLICKAALHTHELRKSVAIRAFVKDFLAGNAREVQEWEVLLLLEDIVIDEVSIDLWDFEILKLSKSKAEELLGSQEGTFADRCREDFSDKVVLRVTEWGNSPKLVADRARERARFAVRLLRFYLSHSLNLHDNQLLFSAGDGLLVVDNTSQLRYISYKTRRKPWGLLVSEEPTTLLEIATRQYDLFSKMPERIRACIRVALHWYGLSIEEESQDQKIIALCTALEALLTKRNDKKKGEAISYRMALLLSESGKGYPDPDRLLWIYELRSYLVHGSRVQLATSSEYSSLKFVFREVFDCYVSYVSRCKLTKPSQIVASLESSESVEQLATILEGWGTERSLQIREALIQEVALRSDDA